MCKKWFDSAWTWMNQVESSRFHKAASILVKKEQKRLKAITSCPQSSLFVVRLVERKKRTAFWQKTHKMLYLNFKKDSSLHFRWAASSLRRDCSLQIFMPFVRTPMYYIETFLISKYYWANRRASGESPEITFCEWHTCSDFLLSAHVSILHSALEISFQS